MTSILRATSGAGKVPSPFEVTFIRIKFHVVAGAIWTHQSLECIGQCQAGCAIWRGRLGSLILEVLVGGRNGLQKRQSTAILFQEDSHHHRARNDHDLPVPYKLRQQSQHQ